MSKIKVKNKNGEWVELSTEAINTRIMDVEGNFESDNVEGALRELAEKQPDFTLDPAVELQIKKNTLEINNAKKEISNVKGNVQSTVNTLNDHEDRISYLEANGGGGGGSIVPTITSTFKDCAIEKGQDFTIPIFFSSPSGGTGTAYVIVNNMEVDYLSVKQGNNNLKILGKHLTQTDNIVGIYVKDRAGLVSNQLNWNVIAGGIEVTTTFDYEVDYGITDEIIMPYNIETGIDGEITLHLTIDGTTYDIPSKKGYNQITISEYVNSLGTHSVSMYATVDKYTSQPLSFNLIITSTTELYLSTTFVNGSKFTFGTPISINYRLSKKSTELFDVSIYVDDKLEKTQELTVGSYYWTYTKASVGEHTIIIRVVSKDGSEDKSLTITLEVEKGIYIPVEDITEDLQLDLNAAGKSNNDNHNGFWKDSSGNKRDAEMINFNFSTNGFINGHVVCDNNAYIKIPYSPWADNAKRGSTIDLIYTPINSGNEDARVIDYTFITDQMAEGEIKPFKGLFADIRQAIVSSSNSGSSSGKVSLDENSGEIHLTWVLDRANKFCKTYINGILSRIMFLSDSGSGNNAIFEDFSHNEFIYLNSTKGENCGTYDIKRLRIWGHALTSDEVLRTHIAAIDDLERQEEVYNFNYNNTTLPRMDLFGDITNMTPYQTVDMRIQYTSPNEEKYGPSFNTGIQNNPVKIQGTSSLQYVRHNYTIYLRDEFGAPMMYNPYGSANAMPDSVFCLKADYIESSHGNNTGMANFINDNVYDTKLPPQLENPAIRTTIAGFPIVLYMNGEYLGVYNFNHDRYSTESYGYDYKKYPNMLVYEINSNSNTSAGAFYRYGDNVESSANINERDYYARDFKLIYGNRTSDSDTYSEIKSLVEWVSVAEQDLFRETISEHFNKEYLFRYLLTVLMIGGVDSLGKNMKITTFDGKVWYPTFYDLDTCLGIDNSGYLTIEPDVEIEEGSFNTSNSNLWTKVMNFFASELKEEWALMRQGRFTLDNLLKYVVQNQIEVIPAKYYNDDAQIKYLDFGSLYTYCCHGSKELLVKRWLRERIAYVDSMMGYFTSQDDQVTIRMNKTGYVEFDITSYIPLYFSVKWSNADGGTQTFRVKRGQKQTFNYTSTTATDQEVIIYHAQYIKEINNISNLRPSSCILANATKLNNVEIHSDKLYNVNFTNNKFLRNLDLEGCTALGTVTATGSVLDVSNCNYLAKLNIYKTALTGVLLNTSGGSLKEIYYPTTIQEVQLIKQTLLEKVGLPYGNNGSEIPTSLYNIDIEECPNIRTLNTSEDSSINTKWVSMKYCQNLVIRNSLNYETISLEGFQRLKTIKLENMFNLKSLGFDNMLPKGGNSTLQYMGVSYCPNLTDITMNCTSNDYEVTFADGALLDLSGANTLNSLSSNCIIHGLETIVLPLSVKHLFFTNEYGEGFSSIKNIWSTRCCEINKEGLLPVPIRYNNPDYIGIDFEGMSLNDIDLGALVNIPDAINFNISPTSVNPNFNANRDGVEYPYLQPTGTLDLSNYTESLARFFNGVDLDKLEIIVNNPLPQTDLSYCFYNSTFTSDDRIAAILNNIRTVNNMEYCFYKTSVKDVSILNNINFLNGTSLAYCFAECANLSKLQDIVLNENIGNAEYMFSGSGLATIKNVTTSCRNIKGMFSNCNNLVNVTNFNANGTTSYESLFEGCNGMSVAPIIVIPNNITNISRMYKDCLGLVSIDGFVLHGNITVVDDFIAGCDNLINANNVTISGTFYNDIFRGINSLKYVNNLLINYVGRSMTFANMFDGCTNLIEMSFHDDSYVRDVISMDYMFRGTSMKTVDFSNVNFEKIVSYKYMFADCLMEEFSFTVPKTITSIQGMLSNCRNLKTLRNFNISTNVNVTDWLLDTPIENLINCSFYNQNTSFKNNTTLKKIEGFNYTGNNLANYFEGCSSLQSAKLTIGSKVTKANNLFASCPLLTSVEFNSESDLSGVTTISDMFNGDSNLTTIKNLKITNPSTIANNTTLSNCPINNTDGLYINSNSAIQMFRMGSESKITQFTDFELGAECNNLSGAFRDYPLLTKDITLPSHVANVSNAFNNCLAMENIVSNWTNSYDRNNDDDLSNDVITEGCYAGSNNIKYINDELYMNEYGELTAMQYIPPEWGGNASYEDNQTVFDVKITEDNLTYTMLGNVGEYKTNWGDGTEDMNISHEYSKPGTYTIVTENTSTFGQGTVVDSSISSPIVKFRALNKSLTNGSHLFDGWTNLLKVNKLNNTFDSYDYMFNDCGKLVDVDLSECTLSQTVTTMAYMCNGCAKFTKTPISVIPDTCTNISYLFANSGITDISGMTFGSGISNVTSWIPPKLTTANNVTIKNNNVNFNECSTLISAKNFTFDGVDSDRMFRNCTNLADVSGLKLTRPVNIGSPSNSYGFFSGCTSLTVIDFSNSDLSNLRFIGNLMTYCTSLKEVIGLKIPSSAVINNIFWSRNPLKLTNFILEKDSFNFGSMNQWVKPFSEINGITIGSEVTNITGLFEGAEFLTNDFDIPSHITNCTNCFKGCTSMTHVHSNWNNTYTNGITSTDCYAGCNGITHIDSENVMAYEGDCGLDYLPIPWGGRGFEADVTSIMEVTAKTDNFEWQPCSAMGHFTLRPVSYINWGDGTSTTVTTFSGAVPTHTYAKAGVYMVKSHSTFGSGLSVNKPGMTKLLNIACRDRNLTTGAIANRTHMNWGLNGASDLVYADVSNFLKYGVKLSSIGVMFQNCPNLTTIVGIEDLDISNCTITDNMFSNCRNLASLDLSSWDTSKVTSMASMFNNCRNLASLDLSSWDTSKVTNMNSTFSGCSSLVELNLTGWNTSSLSAMTAMFNGCSNLQKILGIEHFNISQVTDLGSVFNGCGITSINLDSWDFNGVTNVSNMFRSSKIQTIDTTNWDVSTITSFTDFCNGATSEYITLTFSGSMWAVMHNCKNVKHVTWKNCTVVIDNYSFPSFGVQQTAKWQITFDNAIIESQNGTVGNLQQFSHLTVESLMSIINALMDRTGMDSSTLTIGSAHLAKLTPEQIKVATDKNWTVV